MVTAYGAQFRKWYATDAHTHKKSFHCNPFVAGIQMTTAEIF